MIDYDITVATPDDVEIDLAREPLPEGVLMNQVSIVSNDTDLHDTVILELARASQTPEQLGERLDKLLSLNLSPSDIYEFGFDWNEALDNIDDVVVYDDYADWLENQDYIVGELRNVMPAVADAIIDSIDPEVLFDAGDQSSYEVLPSGKIIYLAYK